MKLRKINLLSIEVGDKEPPVTFAGLAKTVITTAGENGLSCDEVLLAVKLVADLAAATAAKEEVLLLTDEQAAFLKARLEVFRWGAQHPVFAQFILHVRNLPYAEVEAKK
jgi:hypothetical protein